MHNGAYPAWGTSPEWDEVLRAKQTLADCQLFGCLPSALDGEDYHELQVLRAIAAAERNYNGEEQRRRARAAQRRAGRRGR